MNFSNLARQHWAALRALLVLTVIVGLAYPVFIWAALALQYALDTPRVRHDVLLLLVLGLAILARTQFAVLLVAAPFALCGPERICDIKKSG